MCFKHASSKFTKITKRKSITKNIVSSGNQGTSKHYNTIYDHGLVKTWVTWSAICLLKCLISFDPVLIIINILYFYSRMMLKKKNVYLSKYAFTYLL